MFTDVSGTALKKKARGNKFSGAGVETMGLLVDLGQEV